MPHVLYLPTTKMLTGKMAKIYTKTGDAGETSLFGGMRVGKNSPRVGAYGSVDELNSHLGLCRAKLKATGCQSEEMFLHEVQNDLFRLGTDLATPPGSMHANRVDETRIAALEREIDRMQEALPQLQHFILPAGSEATAEIHVSRAVCRRAEREVVELSRKETVPASAIAYLNRLSDALFVLARYVSQKGRETEEAWRQ